MTSLLLEFVPTYNNSFEDPTNIIYKFYINTKVIFYLYSIFCSLICFFAEQASIYFACNNKCVACELSTL